MLHPEGNGIGASWTPPLARADGYALCTAAEALLKGFLETELDVHAVFAVRASAFGGLFAVVDSEEHRVVLARNGVEVIEVAHASRGIELAAQEASRGRRTAVLVGNEELDAVILALAEIARVPLPVEAGICLVLEDNPYAVPTTCPRRVCRRTGLVALEPSDLSALRDACDGAMRLSRGTRRPAVIVTHVSLLRSGATLPVAPNRQVSRMDHAAWLRRRRVQRAADATDPLQIVRRMEVNRLEHLPNPGEREQYGFIAVGAAATAVRHMLDELGLSGRVPLLRLVALDPLDEAVVSRILTRCHHVIVVEPRPGSVAPRIVALAQTMKSIDTPPAQVWWDSLPAAAGDVEKLGINDGMRTSLLTRRVIRLLHEVRPRLNVEERLARIPASVATMAIPRRSHGIGSGAAREAIEAAIAAAAATLASRTGTEIAARGIVSERGAPPECATLCTIEVWDLARFVRDSIALIDQVARESGPRVVVVTELGGSSRVDCERLARAVAGSGVESRLAFVSIDLNDHKGLHAALVAAADSNSLTVVTARDGPPARYDIAAHNRRAQEIDRDGFLRQQRFVLPADNACELRDPGLATQVARGLLRGADPLQAEPRVERLSVPGGQGIHVKVDLLYEQVEIVRSRPPAAIDALREPLRMAPPTPLHATQGIWRAHLAGIRGDAPGAAGQVIAEAGRAMGFRVEWTHLGAAIGPGRRAWSQVMFTRMDTPSGSGHDPAVDGLSELPSVAVQIPYGEADLVMGVDPVETIRAVATDPQLRVASPTVTAIVANTRPLEDQIDPETMVAAAQLASAVEATTMPDRRVLLDFASDVRGIFLTDRPVDLVIVGVAFQRGFIPVSIEALEAAVRRLEARGYARSFEAIQLGRVLGGSGAPAQGIPRGTRTDAATDALRLARRVSADRQLGRRRDRIRGERLRTAVAATLARMSDLGSTSDGRTALRDFATAMRRCEMWGGFEYAMRYASVIERLLGSTPDASALELAKLTILPVAELFLIRDLWYVGALTTSLDQSHRIRATLGVRLARGDEIHRRYLHRLDIRLRSRQWVIEFRSSDWPDRILRATLPWIPSGLRGTLVQRQSRETLVRLMERAAREVDRRAEWIECARILLGAAIDGSLRTLDSEGIKAIAPDTTRNAPGAEGA